MVQQPTALLFFLMFITSLFVIIFAFLNVLFTFLHILFSFFDISLTFFDKLFTFRIVDFLAGRTPYFTFLHFVKRMSIFVKLIYKNVKRIAENVKIITFLYILFYKQNFIKQFKHHKTVENNMKPRCDLFFSLSTFRNPKNIDRFSVKLKRFSFIVWTIFVQSSPTVGH